MIFWVLCYILYLQSWCVEVNGMKKSEIILTGLLCFFIGIVFGFLLSPIKKGIDIGNDSGNTTNNNYGNDEEKLFRWFYLEQI